MDVLLLLVGLVGLVEVLVGFVVGLVGNVDPVTSGPTDSLVVLHIHDKYA